jgi:hypothetical protein
MTVTLPNNASFGSLSIKAINPNSSPANSFTNVTIVRQEAGDPPAHTSVNGIGIWVGNPANGDILSADQITVSRTDFYETPNRTFPTGLDGTIWLKYSVIPEITNITTEALPGTGDYVYSIKINGTVYGDTGSEGWQYRVYRPDGYNRVRLSEYVGADSMMLRSGDILFWKYDVFDSPDLFPASIAPAR